MGMGEDERIQERLAELREEHSALDAIILGEKSVDRLRVQRLKKRKLWIKDEISRLSSILCPDITA